jgi:hypothetical protein
MAQNACSDVRMCHWGVWSKIEKLCGLGSLKTPNLKYQLSNRLVMKKLYVVACSGLLKKHAVGETIPMFQKRESRSVEKLLFL